MMKWWYPKWWNIIRQFRRTFNDIKKHYINEKSSIQNCICSIIKFFNIHILSTYMHFLNLKRNTEKCYSNWDHITDDFYFLLYIAPKYLVFMYFVIRKTSIVFKVAFYKCADCWLAKWNIVFVFFLKILLKPYFTIESFCF